MAASRDPDEVEQTLAPGAAPKSAPAGTGDTPAQPLATDATISGPVPAGAGDTLAPAAPVDPVTGRVGRGFTAPSIWTAPPPAGHGAPVRSDETLPSGTASELAATLAPAVNGGAAGDATDLLPFGTTGGLAGPVAPAPPPPRPLWDFNGAPVPDDATIEQLVTYAPAGDAGATFASGRPSERTGQTEADADATRVPATGPGDADATRVSAAGPGDAGATMATPTSRTVASGPGGASGARSHDTAPVGGRARPGANETGTMVGRFALRSLHAAGGLGEVFTARDTELNREVAVKRIKSRYADDPGSRRRFLTEAELTARLDHPGVVPVFGLVNDARGRPVYAMRFIRGETLKDEIDRYHGAGPGAEATEAGAAEKGAPAVPAPAEKGVPRTVAFRHLLSRFVYVCQAIAYAHEKGIIHRDIKPANVMVGKFGEVLVVDWGLAKSLTDGPDFDRIMRTAADGGFRHDPEATDLPSHLTMAGTAVGTPSYMPPEQAAGELDKVGPRADVYSLGATLFAVLAGRAPFVGKSPGETLEQVRRGAFDPPTAVNADCPKPLAAVCLKAMALRQEDRYATALELAADVERWLSDEPVSAYRDPPLARLARWARRHPTRVAAGVSLLLAGLVAAGGIAWAVHVGEQNTRAKHEALVLQEQETAAALKRVTEQEAATAGALEKVKVQKLQTERERGRAESARDLARKRYERAVDAYNTLVHDLDKKLGDRANMQAVRQTLLLNATEGLQKLVEGRAEGDIGADRTLVAAHRQMGEVYQLIGKTDEAKKQFGEAVRVARAVRAQAGPDPEAREADRDLARTLTGQAAVLTVGDSRAALAAADEAVALLEALVAARPDPVAQQDLAAAKARRAAIRMERGDTGKALEDCREAQQLRQALFDHPPQALDLTPQQQLSLSRDRERALADSFDALAELQLRTGATAAASDSAAQCLRVRGAVAARFADQPDVLRELAAAHARLGEAHFDRALMTAAATQYRAAVGVLEKLAADDPDNAGARADLAALYGRLGHVQIRTGEPDAAVANTLKSRDLCQRLRDLDPGSAKAQRDLALARERYGDALLFRARDAGAEAAQGLAEYQAGLALLQNLVTLDAESVAAGAELARGWERVGDGKLALKDAAGALQAFGESVRLRRATVTRDRDSASAKRDLAVGLYKQADANCVAGKPAAANQLSSEATKLLVDLTAKNAASGRAQRDLAVAYGKWGQVLAGAGRPTGALLVWQTSLDRFRALADLDAGNKQAKEEEAAAWERLAGFYSALGNTERALASARRAVRLWTDLWDDADTRTKAGQRRLALARIRCGDLYTEVQRFGEATNWYTQALKDVEQMKRDPLLGPVNDLANEKLLFLAAVRAGLNNPQNLKEEQYAGVRVAALRTIAAIEVRADHTAAAAAVAEELARGAKEPDDLFAAARTFAGCAAATHGTDSAKDSNARRAVAVLEAAVGAGYRNADTLTTSEWDAVRDRAPEEFARAHAKLLKLRGTE